MIRNRTESQFVDFTWWLPNGGYRWEEYPDLEGDKRALVPKDGSGPGLWYLPLRDHTGLFREFAAIDGSADAVLRFANRYGALFGEHGRREPLRHWQVEVWRLQRTLTLWDLVRRHDLNTLAQHIVWEGQGEESQVYYDPYPITMDPDPLFAQLADTPPLSGRSRSPSAVSISGPRMDDGWWERFKPGDVLLPAIAYIQLTVSLRLNEEVSPRLDYDPGQKTLRLQLAPKNLMRALWLQFAQAINADKEYRQCAECGKWYEVSPEVARTNRRYCSGACRSRALRGRKERARQMRAEGKSIKEIARELQSDTKVVKGWLNDRKG
jgi:hypothetical protein